MISIYIAYFNSGTEIVPLRQCENYTDAEKSFEGTAQELVKVYYGDADRNQKLANPTCATPFHPVKIVKYEDGINSSALLATASIKADVTFATGLVFVRKRYEACVYEKICYPGSVYNSYVIKYLGVVSVMMQDLPEHTATVYRLKDLVDAQEVKIAKLEAEIKRLEYTNNVLEHYHSQLQSQTSTEGVEILAHTAFVAPKTKSAHREIINKQKEISSSLLSEIHERMLAGNLFSRTSKVANKKNIDAEIESLISDLDALGGGTGKKKTE